MLQQTEKQLLLDSYVTFASFLTDSIGPQSSVVVFDVDESGEDGRVVGLSGNTGERALGDAMTPLIKHVFKSIKSSGYTKLLHVDTEASTTAGRVKLCFYPIRVDKEVVGLLVLSFEIDILCGVLERINQFLDLPQQVESNAKLMNAIESGPSLTEYMHKIIDEKIQSISVPVERMTNEERRQIIHELDRMEVFFVKDSARITAAQLGISVPTLYRLLKQN